MSEPAKKEEADGVSINEAELYKELYKHYTERIVHFENFQRSFILFTVPILAYILEFLLNKHNSDIPVTTAYYGTLVMLFMFHFFRWLLS